MRPRRPCPAPVPWSAFAGFCYPPEVIVLAVRWSLRFAQSYRDVEELLAERGVEVDHTTVYRWVQRFAPLLAEAARPCRHAVGDRWKVDETSVKVAGRWRYVYRAIDQLGQVIDVFVAARRNMSAARRCFERAIGTTNVTPIEVVTDRAPTYPAVVEALLSAAWHRTDRYATTISRPITPARRRGDRRCAGSNRTAAPRWCWPGTPSCSSFGADTTNSRSRSQQACELLSRSTSWPWRSDSSAGYGFGMPPVDQMHCCIEPGDAGEA
jgi:transposase-like protein